MTAVLPAAVVASAADRLLRPRLLQRCHALLHAPAAALWIGAGAGMGKSTLARQLLAHADGRSCLVPLDEGARDAVGALRALAGAAGFPVALWREQLAAPAVGLRAAWRTLWAQWGPGLVVIDDLHRAGSDDELAAWLPTALEQLPASAAADAGPGPRLVLLSRRAPPPALARCLVQRRLARLPAAELLFDADELQAWAPGAASHVGSWPAALAALPRGGDAETLDESTLHQLVATEVLPELNARERELLTRLAVLPGPVDAALAAALGGAVAVSLAGTPDVTDAPEAPAARPAPDAPARLDAVAERGLLVDRSLAADGTPRWRLHDLLAATLRRLASTPTGHWRAAVRQLEQRGDTETAWRTALLAAREADAAAGARDAAAWPEVARLLVALAPSWLAQCRHRALAEAALEVPSNERTPALWAALAAARAAFDPRGGRDAAVTALAAMDAPTSPLATSSMRLALLSQIVATYFQTFDSTEPLAAWLRRIEALAPPSLPEDAPRDATTEAHDHAPADPHADAALAIGAYSALFLRTPHDPALPRWAARVRPLPAAPIDPNLRLRAAMLLAKQAWYTAAHAEAALLPDAARGALADARCTPYARLLWGLSRQYQAWAQADPAAGRAASAEALAEAAASGVHGLDRHLRLHDACFARLLGDDAAAQSQLDAAAAGADASRRMEAWHLFSVKAWFALEDGALALADEAARQAIHAGQAMGPAPQAMSWVIAAQVALAAGGDAGPALAALRAAATRDGNARAALFAHWVEAVAALEHGDTHAALPPLAAALATMQRHGHGLWFGLHRAAAARLAALALTHDVQPAAAARLVREHRLAPPPQADARWPWDVRIEHAGRPELLSIEVDGTPVALGAKLPRRPLELLQALIDCGGRAPAARLADRLWPEAEGDRAMDAFEVALRRLRSLLGHADALLLAGGTLALNPSRVRVEGGPRRT